MDLIQIQYLMMLSFNDPIRKYSLKNRATSIIKIQQILSSLSVTDLKLYSSPSKTDRKIVSLHPFWCSQWVLYFHECSFDSYGIPPPNIQLKFITKRIGKCLFSAYKIQSMTTKRYSFCAAHCLYIIYSTKK